MDYPIVTAGLVMGPRGIGTMISMFVVGKLIGRVEVRWLLLMGLILTAWAMGDMTGWTRNVSEMRIVETGFVQGAGLGFLFVPLSVVTFSTLSAAQRGDGTGLYNLSRNIGSSVSISVVTALLSENVQANHAAIAAYVTLFNPMFHLPAVARMLSPYTAQGRAALDGIVTTQATMIAYIDDFRLLMLMAICAMPPVFLLKKAAGPVAVDHSAVME